MRVLILGGTTEASRLAAALAGRLDVTATLSLAGRTATPLPSAIPHRVGGFGGPDGLREYLLDEGIDAVVDATHPFAQQMSRHAAEACRAIALPLVLYTRPPWRPTREDRWTFVPDAARAAAALGTEPRRVFLTVGRLSLPAFAAAPHHIYLIRTIEPPRELTHLPRHELIGERGPFRLTDELALMREKRIEILVTKNSGGDATWPKMEAARQLGIPAIVVVRPALPDGVRVLHELPAVMDWLRAQVAAP